MKSLAAIAVLAAALVVGTAAAASGPSYPKRPEGSTLTTPSIRNAQLILLKNTVSNPAREAQELILLADARNALSSKFNLYTHAGHTPRRGYALACLGSVRFNGMTLYLAAWSDLAAHNVTVKLFRRIVTKQWSTRCR